MASSIILFDRFVYSKKITTKLNVLFLIDITLDLYSASLYGTILYAPRSLVARKKRRQEILFHQPLYFTYRLDKEVVLFRHK
jgi:hypothetical protein